MSVSRSIAVAGLAAVMLSVAACGDENAVDITPAASPSPIESPLTVAPSAASPSSTELPPITVAEPMPGDDVSSPVLISGTADVFEATVSMRILDANGDVLVRDFTTATCGTGCRGDYEKALEFDVAESQDGTVEVWWDSPKDGSRQDVVSIPVTLLP